MQRLHRYFTIFFATLLSLGLLLVVAVGTVSAHAKVISATPGIGATIATAPTTVTVHTAENMDPDPKLSNLFVYGPSGELISQGDAKVSLTQPQEMSVTIKPEENGTYIVRWITTSAEDKEPDEGAFFFKVEPTAAAPTPAPVTTPTPAANDSMPIVPIAIASVIALLVGLGAGFGIGRNRSRPVTSSTASSGGSDSSAKQEEATTQPKP